MEWLVGPKQVAKPNRSWMHGLYLRHSMSITINVRHKGVGRIRSLDNLVNSPLALDFTIYHISCLRDRISPDIRSLVYRYGIFNGDVSDWEYMLQRYMNEDVAGEKTNLLRGLAATEDIALIDR